MQTLESSQYAAVRLLLAELMPFNNSIAAVLAGNNPGTVYVDQPQTPHLVMLTSPEGTYIAGDDPSADQISALKNHVHHLMHDEDVEALWLICEPAWQRRFADFLSRDPLPTPRQHYTCTAVTFDWRAHIPDGFAVRRIDEALLARTDLTIPDHIHGWIDNNWGTRENFFERGFGFVTEELETHQIASWSLCDCVGDQACEIGIHTHPDYRQRGLAALTAAAAADFALGQGLTRVGWHCSADNVGSWRTALRVGFTHERDYVGCTAFRSEAIHWVEAGRSQAAAGDYRAAAEHYIRADDCENKPDWGEYIPFYAACAFARLGDADSAWTWLHRAVAQGFDDVNTLQSAAALKPLQSSPAWDTLLQSLEG